MTVQNPSSPTARPERPRLNGAVMGRALQYLWREKVRAGLPYLFLLIATLSQLAVPRMVRNIIDAVTKGVMANAVLQGLAQIPSNFLALALPKILAFLNLPFPKQ